MRKIAVIFLFLFLTLPSMAERMNGGVSYNFEKANFDKINEIKRKLPELNYNFINLNYSINFKPINVLSEEDLKYKKQFSNSYIKSYETMTETYEISFSTGKVVEKLNNSNRLLNLLKKEPNNKDLLFAYAIELKNEGDYKRALEIANKAAEIDPDFALFHFLKGDILRCQEKFKEAVEEYLYTTQINPFCADAYYNIAKILELIDEKDLAIDYYTAAFEINPNDEELKEILSDYTDL